MWGPALTAYSHIEPNRMLPEEFQNLEEMYSTLEYLHYTKKLSIQAIFTYALEASGLPPIIYYPIRHGKQFFKREHNCFICEGNFPCDNK